jgi:hypothetical protein
MSELKNGMGELTTDELSRVCGGSPWSDVMDWVHAKGAEEAKAHPTLPCDSFDILCRLGF